MIIAVDFDGTVVERNTEYGDEVEDFELVPFAYQSLMALKNSGHVLILTSCRANIAQRYDWRKNPLWSNRKVPFDENKWREGLVRAQRAYQNMVTFVNDKLSGLFDAIDDGEQGKVIAHLYLDDRAFRITYRSWQEVANAYGEPERYIARKGSKVSR